jgi:ribulose-phosphate 3-epimerase
MAGMMPKVSELRRLRRELGLKYLIEVDGGIDAKTAPLAVAAGADVLVAGTAVYGKASYAKAIRALR